MSYWVSPSCPHLIPHLILHSSPHLIPHLIPTPHPHTSSPHLIPTPHPHTSSPHLIPTPHIHLHSMCVLNCFLMIMNNIKIINILLFWYLPTLAYVSAEVTSLSCAFPDPVPEHTVHWNGDHYLPVPAWGMGPDSMHTRPGCLCHLHR